MGLHTGTLDRLLSSELAAAQELLGDVKATGAQLRALHLLYESLLRCRDLHMQIVDRVA